MFSQDVSENPDIYLSDDQRMLSSDQEEEIERYEMRISQIQSIIENLEENMDGENDDEIQERIDELNGEIDDINYEIDEIKESPEGDFPDELIEEAIENRVSDVRYDVTGFMDEFGLEYKDYIDKDAFIKAVVDADGYGHTLNGYDGTADDVRIEDELYYVMRLD